MRQVWKPAPEPRPGEALETVSEVSRRMNCSYTAAFVRARDEGYVWPRPGGGPRTGTELRLPASVWDTLFSLRPVTSRLDGKPPCALAVFGCSRRQGIVQPNTLPGLERWCSAHRHRVAVRMREPGESFEEARNTVLVLARTRMRTTTMLAERGWAAGPHPEDCLCGGKRTLEVGYGLLVLCPGLEMEP